MENCYFNYGNWNAKQTFRKTEVKKGIKTNMPHAEKKFEFVYFKCSTQLIAQKISWLK